jgi:hypothetical protein
MECVERMEENGIAESFELLSTRNSEILKTVKTYKERALTK